MQKENKVFDGSPLVAGQGRFPGIRPAGRVESVEEYYFSKKLKEIAEMNAVGKDVINLGVGSPDMPPSQQTVEVFCREIRKDDAHGYQPYAGIPALREGFAEWYLRWYGVELDAKREIQPLIGSKEGILHVSMAFLNPGDGVLVPNPGYPAYTSVSKLVGADIIPYKLEENNGWYPDFDALERLLAERRKAAKPAVRLMWTNYPNMPTGADASAGLYEQLVDFGCRHGIVICNDNPYSFILNEHPQSILSVSGAKEICVELNSMSKSHNMPGWRMAMLASNARFLQWILKVKSNVDSGQFRPMQLAVAEALKAGKEWYDNMNVVYRSRRDVAGRIMEALGCTYDERQVGMFLWGRISDEAESGETLANTVLYEANVFVTPGFIFGSAGDRYVRISLCCKNHLLEKALERVKQIACRTKTGRDTRSLDVNVE
ncbi:MAG: aminotransferase class I/II-fold pyridoxal phosphate-dependent enzyme [Tannerella sp.]|jgi:aspartate/methionine/tyrosine aminotransferase|nr:aminotransferase class I/II-fold pyridoxal phosphate-dependent enzyme [Tannerella sp.]